MIVKFCDITCDILVKTIVVCITALALAPIPVVFIGSIVLTVYMAIHRESWSWPPFYIILVLTILMIISVVPVLNDWYKRYFKKSSEFEG